MFNQDTPALLLLPPTQLDLTQTHDYQSGIGAPAKNPTYELREILIELLEGLKTATAGTFDQVRADYNDKLDKLTVNINAALNDLDRRLEAETTNRIDDTQVLSSYIRLSLAADKMPEEIRQQHEEVISKFLRETATH
jgi:hypothetical protein